MEIMEGAFRKSPRGPVQILAAVVLPLLVGACAASEGPDPGLAAYVDTLGAVDAHAHPMAWVAPDQPPDTDFDALPLGGIPPFDVPAPLREDNPAFRTAQESLYHLDSMEHGDVFAASRDSARHVIMREQGEGFATWVLNRTHIRLMLANRVAMGPGLPDDRFAWVPFADPLMYPLDTSEEAARTPDTEALYPLEAKLLTRYLGGLGVVRVPATLDAYEQQVVQPLLGRWRDAGAVGIKFEVAYLRSLDFAPADRDEAARIYARYAAGGTPTHDEYTLLENYLFKAISRNAGALELTAQIHVTEGFGGYYSLQGSSPLLLESAFDDPDLRGTNFVITHGGWPRVRETLMLLSRPNVYADISMMDLLAEPRALVDALRLWLAEWPGKVLFGTDAFDGGDAQGWDQVAWVASRNARRALTVALDGMVRDGEMSSTRAREVAAMVLRDNAVRAYHLTLP